MCLKYILFGILWHRINYKPWKLAKSSARYYVHFQFVQMLENCTMFTKKSQIALRIDKGSMRCVLRISDDMFYITMH